MNGLQFLALVIAAAAIYIYAITDKLKAGNTMAEQQITADNLNSFMEFDCVIQVHADGTVTRADDVDCYAELNVNVDGTDDFYLPAGWELLSGYTGQYSYNGPVMHSSEYIGGSMARDILATPGHYVALVVESYGSHEWHVSTFTGTKTCANCGLLPLDEEDMGSTCQGEPAGWTVAFKPAE